MAEVLDELIGSNLHDFNPETNVQTLVTDRFGMRQSLSTGTRELRLTKLSHHRHLPQAARAVRTQRCSSGILLSFAAVVGVLPH